MNPSTENIEGKVVESHEYTHAIEHAVNWSHVLLAVVVLVSIFKLGPAIAEIGSSGDSEDRDLPSGSYRSAATTSDFSGSGGRDDAR